MGEWPTSKFRALLAEPVRNGLYKKAEFHGSGVKVVNMGELFKYPRVGAQEMRRMQLSDNEKRSGLLENGDLLFARRSLTAEGAGKCALVTGITEETTFESSIIRARPDPASANSEFLFYLFNSPQGIYLLGTILRQVAVSGITGTDLVELEIPCPELPEQRAIASVLSSLDAKIDLLHRQNKTLEAMAETLFRQWFVEEAEEGWEEMRLDQFSAVGIGRTPPRKEQHWFSTDSADVKWISIKDMAAEGPFIFTTAEYLTEEAVERFRVPVIPKDTVVLSFKMTLGRVKITTEAMLSNEAIAHFRINPDSHVTKEFLYLGLKTYPYESLGTTSTIVDSINSGMIKGLVMQVPPVEEMDRFMEQCGPWFEKIRSNQLQIQTLTALRDTLLPKLMSGEVRVEMNN